jgi:hypothetical protein
MQMQHDINETNEIVEVKNGGDFVGTCSSNSQQVEGTGSLASSETAAAAAAAAHSVSVNREAKSNDANFYIRPAVSEDPILVAVRHSQNSKSQCKSIFFLGPPSPSFLILLSLSCRN